MTLWKIHRSYGENDKIYYDVVPYNMIGHLKCCIKWYGWRGLKWTYLSEKAAWKKAKKLADKEGNNASLCQ